MDKMREAFEAWFYSFTECENMGNPEKTIAFAAWKSATAQCVPEGWVAVPEDPTRAMLDAALNVDVDPIWYEKKSQYIVNGGDIWTAMLEAAPKPGEQA